MKKLFTLVAAALMSLSAMAETYTCGIRIVTAAEATPFRVEDVYCTQNDKGKFDISLKNFYFSEQIYVGDINLVDVDATEEDGELVLASKQIVPIFGGALPVEVKVDGYLTDSDLILMLEIPDANTDVFVTSRGTQIPGGDFEEWHTATTSKGDKTSDEPNNWHSFMSAAGSLAGIVEGFPHVFISDDVREGADGTKSARIISASVFGSISANGTITTGRMKAGSMYADNPDNCAFMDNESEDVDGNGDYFFNEMKGHPTSISMWYKYKAGEGNTANNKASLRAVITDGTYYQDPANKEYTNIVAVAEDQAIPETSEWKQITIPFDYKSYSSNDAEPQSILVTISTCAVAGGGSTSDSNPDELYVDDVTLNYDINPVAITVFDKDIEGFDKDKEDYDITVASVPEISDIDVSSYEVLFADSYYDEPNKTIILLLFNEELTDYKTYKLHLNIDPTGINGVANSSNHAVTGRYSISGQKASKNAKGLVITRYADGSAVKTVK